MKKNEKRKHAKDEGRLAARNKGCMIHTNPTSV
jgi:hypothetical protein